MEEGQLYVDLGRRQVDIEHSWPTVGARGYPTAEQLADWKRLLRARTAFADEPPPPPPRLRLPSPALLWSPEQLAVLAHLDEQLDWLVGTPEEDRLAQMRHPAPTHPSLLTILQGRAGTGKTALLRAIKERIEERLGEGSVLVMATTGTAAMAIGGQTVHSALGIPVASAFTPLVEGRLRAFCLRTLQLKYVIIDEHSGLSSKLLTAIDSRLRQASGVPYLSFGGLAVLLLSSLLKLYFVEVIFWYFLLFFCTLKNPTTRILNSV